MNEMVERVAQAIEAQMTSPSGWQATKEQIDRIGSAEPRQLRTDLARAAIEAMRESTDRMCDAATRSTSAWMNTKLQGVELRRLKHRIRWGAMIDAALLDKAL